MNAMHRSRSRKGPFALKAAFLMAVAVLLPAGSARAETWCLRDFGGDRQTCVFGSASQCTSAAAIGGGICERERLGRTAAAKPMRRASKRAPDSQPD